MKFAVEFLFGEGRSGSEDGGTLGPFEGFGEFTFGKADGVGEGEDDGAGVKS